MWDNISLGYCAADETINFGSRPVSLISENGSVYEALTLASISSRNNEVESSPHVTGIVCSSYICITVGETLVIFDDDVYFKLKTSKSFSSPIDCFYISNNGSFAFVTIRTGEFYCINLNNENIIFCRSLDNEFTCQYQNFIGIRLIETENGTHILILGANGKIYRISNFDFELLANKNGNESFIQNNVTVEIIHGIKFQTSSVTAVALIEETFHSVTYITAESLIRWSGEFEILDLKKLPRIQKLEVLKCTSAYLGLTDDCHLTLIDSCTLDFIFIWDNICVKDFTVVNEKCDNDIVEVLLMSECEEDNSSNNLLLVNLPSFQIKFSLKLSKNCFILPYLSAGQDIYFLEVPRNEILNCVESVRLKYVTENSADLRLDHLLRRRKYDEAEQLAQTCNLNVELVDKARAQHYSNMLQPWSRAGLSPEEISQTFRDFMSLIERIKDLDFVYKISLNFISSDLLFLKELLMFVLNKLVAATIQHSSMETHVQLYITEITHTLERLETFIIIHNGTFESWLQFSRADLLTINCTLLSEKRIDKAALVWIRHQHTFKHKVCEETVESLLKSLPQDVALTDVIPWFCHFFTTVIDVSPISLKFITDWCIEKIESLELIKSAWPDNALGISQRLLDLIKTSSNFDFRSFGNCAALDCYFHHFAPSSPLQRITNLITTLKDLKVLKDQFDISIALSDYILEDKARVVFHVLDALTSDSVMTVMSGFLRQYMFDHNLEPDQIICQYIAGILDCIDWWTCYDHSWEYIVTSLLECITNSDECIKSVLLLLKKATVPWSNIIFDLAQKAVKSGHSLAPEIRHQIKLMPIKVIQKKYGLRHIGQDRIKAIKYIIKKGCEEMLEDALKFASISTKLTDETYFLVLEHFICQGQRQQASQLLDTLEPKLVTSCCLRMLYRTLDMVQECVQNDFLHDICLPYLSAVDFLFNKLNRSSKEIGNYVMENIFVQEMKNMWALSKEFQKCVTLQKFSSSQSRKNILRECLDEILLNIKTDENLLIAKVMRLGELLCLAEDEILLELIKQALANGMHEIIISAARLLLESQTLCSAVPADLRNVVVCSILQQISPIVGMELSSSACVKCSATDLPSWILICCWCRLFCDLLPCEAVVVDSNTITATTTGGGAKCFTEWLFTPLFHDYSIYMDHNSIMKLLRDILILMLDCTTYTEKAVKDAVSEILKLQKAHSNFIFLRVLISICAGLSQSLSLEVFSNTNKQIIDVISQSVLHSLLMKVLHYKKLDTTLSLTMLLLLKNEKASKYLNSAVSKYSRDLNKLEHLSKLGLYHIEIRGSLEHRNYFSFLNVKCKWMKMFKDLGISYGDSFGQNEISNGDLFTSLMTSGVANLNLIQDYCNDFGVDLQESLQLSLEILITSWIPEFSIEKDVDQERMVVKNCEQQILKKCFEIFEAIKPENYTALKSSLLSVWNNINYYYYEMYICTGLLLRYLDKGYCFHHELLLFLKTYRRVQCPQQEEQDQWFHLFPDSIDIPQISQWRLPFNSFWNNVSLKKLLKQEINFSTYESWLSVCGILGLPEDFVCTTAIQETMTKKYWKHDTLVNESFSLQHHDSFFLSVVSKCLSHFNNLEVASANSYSLVNRMPPGVDQLAALKLCLSYTNKWAKEMKTPKASQRLKIVKDKYRCCSTTHILYKYDIALPNYLKLVQKPEELIHNLYKDPSLISRFQDGSGYYPDINSAVKELATLHEIDVVSFWQEELNSLLDPSLSLKSSDLDDTQDITAILRFSNSNDVSYDDESLLRACYVLKLMDVQTSANYLIYTAFDQSCSTSVSVHTKFRALQCLVAITDYKSLETLTKRSVNDIRSYMKSLLFTSQLEILGFSYSLQDFLICNKVDLIKTIWKSQSRHPKALSILAQICVEYEIYHDSIWIPLLLYMAKFEMVKELKILLPRLTEQLHIIRTPAAIQAWTLVILTPFAKGGVPLQTEQETACIHSLLALHSCPVADSLDLKETIDHCFRLQRYDFIIALVPFLDSTLQGTVKDKILSEHNFTSLSESLNKLLSQGVFSILQAQQILKL